LVDWLERLSERREHVRWFFSPTASPWFCFRLLLLSLLLVSLLLLLSLLSLLMVVVVVVVVAVVRSSRCGVQLRVSLTSITRLSTEDVATLASTEVYSLRDKLSDAAVALRLLLDPLLADTTWVCVCVRVCVCVCVCVCFTRDTLSVHSRVISFSRLFFL
jgi:hypothetical protein